MMAGISQPAVTSAFLSEREINRTFILTLVKHIQEKEKVILSQGGTDLLYRRQSYLPQTSERCFHSQEREMTTFFHLVRYRDGSGA